MLDQTRGYPKMALPRLKKDATSLAFMSNHETIARAPGKIPRSSSCREATNESSSRFTREKLKRLKVYVIAMGTRHQLRFL